MTTISAQCVVKNEARFVWFSIMSIIDFVDKIYILDTGSTDGTIEILKSIEKTHPRKIILETQFFEEFDEEKVRQYMLEKVDTDWFLVLDGDEVWWKSSIEKLTLKIQDGGGDIESIVVPTINVVGDMYHYQEEAAGLYKLAGRTGHLAIRAINRNIPGIHSLGEHGVWGWVDQDKKMIQDRDRKNIVFLDAPYLHTTFLQRSGNINLEETVLKRKQKRKHEIGIPFSKDYFYPESFFFKAPDFVSSVWDPMQIEFFVQSLVESPLRKFKRRYLPKKVGY